ncbi:unnamed protein product [Brassica napus]|uniref:(rape) hypothetical protein n=1 Tax=Brassica napus TaxID=3708 RepID=A0A816TA61_BRANA|nr:unnamed protein product [Brassica napus]
MGDSVPLKLALPELKYPIGSQPKEKSAINQYSAKIVYAILTRSIVSVKENEGWFHLGRSHKLSDVVDQLRNTREDASEERICLAMLILVESILLRKSKGGSFPLEYAKKMHRI